MVTIRENHGKSRNSRVSEPERTLRHHHRSTLVTAPLPPLALPIRLDKHNGEFATESQFTPHCRRGAYIEPKPNSVSSAINIFHLFRFCRSIPHLPPPVFSTSQSLVTYTGEKLGDLQSAYLPDEYCGAMFRRSKVTQSVHCLIDVKGMKTCKS